MNINAISGAANRTESSNNAVSGGQETDSNMFMTLLVAQLKNQDPLEPQDGTAFVAQLAQFNSLDNLIDIKQSMEQLVAYIQQGTTTNT
jgi:flagellar basal-body rod modification protein FlgD